MNKLIFQLGILGFCVSAVIFGANGAGLLEIVSRAFLVFVGIVLAVVMIVLVGGSMVENNKRRQSMKEGEDAQASAAAQRHQ
jgi:uncharacterized membrane protein YgaE (UPF0421/DUF939 family)